MATVVDMSAGKKSKADTPAVHRILLVGPSPPPYGGMALQARLLEKMLRQDGIPVISFASNFPFSGWLGMLDRVRGLRAVLRAAVTWPRLWKQAGRVDVVHVLAASWLYFFLVVYPAVIVGKLRCKRVVLNYRGGEARQFFRWFGWAAKPLFAISDVVAVPSEFLAELIRDRFGTQALIVPNIVDSSAFRYRPRVGLQPKLLVTRHLEELYDIESVIRAFQKVQRNHPDASLWIAGTGSLEDYLRGMVKDWNLGNVRFLGHVAHQALPAIYDQCDIYLNASRADNFPGALLEASASGLVVISTAVGGIPFIYQDGKSALLVAPGDWEGLARGAETVLQEPSLALELCTQAVAIIRKCEWCDVSKALYKAYGSSTKADGRKLAACASTENSFSTSIHRTSGRGL